jgi:Fur family peroxide stress response transcriptional regulator
MARGCRLTVLGNRFIVGHMPTDPQELQVAMCRVGQQLVLRRALEAAGYRYTAQRAAVFGYLETAKTHPTAEEVYCAVRRDMPRISLATVYKALDALILARVVNKLSGGGGRARYDYRGQDHYHLRDEATGEIRDLGVDFDPDLLAKIDPALVQKLAGDGFEVTGYRLEVLGRFAD